MSKGLRRQLEVVEGAAAEERAAKEQAEARMAAELEQRAQDEAAARDREAALQEFAAEMHAANQEGTLAVATSFMHALARASACPYFYVHAMAATSNQANHTCTCRLAPRLLTTGVLDMLVSAVLAAAHKGQHDSTFRALLLILTGLMAELCRDEGSQEWLAQALCNLGMDADAGQYDTLAALGSGHWDHRLASGVPGWHQFGQPAANPTPVLQPPARLQRDASSGHNFGVKLVPRCSTPQNAQRESAA